MSWWFSGFGDDGDQYGGSGKITCGEVRWNYIRSHHHVVAVEPEIARLREERAMYMRQVVEIDKRLRAIERLRKGKGKR